MSTQHPDITGTEETTPERNVDGLERGVRKARMAQAAHFDALVDIRDAQTLRLAALHQKLSSLAASDERLKRMMPVQMEDGFPPRVWIDNISYVVMEPDPRTYRLVRQDDTGHSVITETTDMTALIAKVKEYCSHRLIEQERNGVSQANGNGRISSQVLMAWLTGFTLGVLSLLIVGFLTGRINF